MKQDRGNAPQQLIEAAADLRDEADTLSFGEPVTHVYNPLRYAWAAHEAYVRHVRPAGADVLLLGMNPGPWGMAQTGVPFGEVEVVRDWLGIETRIGKPRREHPKRPVDGFACHRSEVSGQRLWGLFRRRFGTPARFFARHFVANYCPLVFMEVSGRNRTPDKLPADQRDRLIAICDRHLKRVIETLDPRYLVGVGVYAEKCLRRVTEAEGGRRVISRILHPSPASPAANRDWAAKATGQLVEADVWGQA